MRSAHRILLIALSIATATNVGAQTPLGTPSPRLPAYRGRLLGVYDVDTGQPIEGADIIDVFSKTIARTTKTGTVSLVFLPDGGSLVKVQKIGYDPTTIMVAISPSDTIPFTVLLRQASQRLPTVVTKDSSPRYIAPGLRAFEERRKAGFGKFVSEAELKKQENRNLTSVIRMIGVKVECTSASRPPVSCFATSSRTGTRSCTLDVYLDGIKINDNDRDLERMRSEQYAGIEVYADGSTVPAQYNKTGSSCGVMLLWTRER